MKRLEGAGQAVLHLRPRVVIRHSAPRGCPRPGADAGHLGSISDPDRRSRPAVGLRHPPPPSSASTAENLFLRKQLARYLERQIRPRRTDNASRIALVALSRLVEWRDLLTSVRPETFVRWHRDLYRLFWRVRSRPRSRPRIPAELQQLSAEMAAANRTWGEERIAAELRLKLGLTVSPRTVRRYMSRRDPSGLARGRGPRSSQSRRRGTGLRLLRDGDCHLPARLRLRHPGHRDPPNRALESDPASHRPVDDPAVPRRPPDRCTLPRPRTRSRRHLRTHG